MSRKNTIVVNHNPGDPLPDTDTDWATMNAMTDEDIQQGIAADPDANPITEEDIATGRVRPVVNVKPLREGLGLT
jgi:putative transcriptional regulator